MTEPLRFQERLPAARKPAFGLWRHLGDFVSALAPKIERHRTLGPSHGRLVTHRTLEIALGRDLNGDFLRELEWSRVLAIFTSSKCGNVGPHRICSGHYRQPASSRQHSIRGQNGEPIFFGQCPTKSPGHDSYDYTGSEEAPLGVGCNFLWFIVNHVEQSSDSICPKNGIGLSRPWCGHRRKRTPIPRFGHSRFSLFLGDSACPTVRCSPPPNLI